MLSGLCSRNHNHEWPLGGVLFGVSCLLLLFIVKCSLQKCMSPTNDETMKSKISPAVQAWLLSTMTYYLALMRVHTELQP